jgi:hypothetical protein
LPTLLALLQPLATSKLIQAVKITANFLLFLMFSSSFVYLYLNCMRYQK